MTHFVRLTMLALSLCATFPAPAHASEPTANSTPPAATTPEAQKAKVYYEQAVAGISGSLQAAKTAVEDGSARERAETLAGEITTRVAQFDRDFNRMSAPQRLWILDQMIAGVTAYHSVGSRDQRLGVVALPAAAMVIVPAMILAVAPLMGGAPRHEIKLFSRMFMTGVGLIVVATAFDYAFFDELPVLRRNLESLRASTAVEVKNAELR